MLVVGRINRSWRHHSIMQINNIYIIASIAYKHVLTFLIQPCIKSFFILQRYFDKRFNQPQHLHLCKLIHFLRCKSYIRKIINFQTICPNNLSKRFPIARTIIQMSKNYFPKYQKATRINNILKFELQKIQFCASKMIPHLRQNKTF